MPSKPQRPRAGTAGAIFDIGPTPYHPIVRWQDQHFHHHSYSLPGGYSPNSSPSSAAPGHRAELPRSTSLGSAIQQTTAAAAEPEGSRSTRRDARLKAPAHARSWYTSETQAASASLAPTPLPYLSQTCLRIDSFRETIVAPRASVNNTVEIEPPSQPPIPTGSTRLSKVAPSNARSTIGHQRREGPTLATPQAYMASSPASSRSAAPFTQHHTLGLSTPQTAYSRTAPFSPQAQRVQHKINVPRSPLHGRFIPVRAFAPHSSRYAPPMRPCLPSPSYAQRHAYSGSSLSITSDVSVDSHGIPRKATKLLGLPPPPPSPSLTRFDAKPPRPRFITHGGTSSVSSLNSAQSMSTASYLDSALMTPAHDAYTPSGISPGHPARGGLFVDGGGGQPVPTKAQRLLGLMPTKAERLLGVAQVNASSSGADLSEGDLDIAGSDGPWCAAEAYGDDAAVVDKISLEPPRLPDLRPPSGSFENVLLSLAKEASVARPRPTPRRINALSPNARESHFLPGSPVFLRKNAKRLRLQSSKQSLRQQAARYTIVSVTPSPRLTGRLVAPETSMKSVRSAASTQLHILAVSPVPPELKDALAQAHGAVKTLEEWERDGWSDDGRVPSADDGFGELMLLSPGTTEESGEIIQAAVCRLSRAVSLADISEAQTLPPSVPPLPTPTAPVLRSDTTTSIQTQSSFSSTFSCSQPTILLRTSSGARPKRLLHRAPLPVELVFSPSSPTFYLSSRKYSTLVDFLSSSPSTTFCVVSGSNQTVRRVVYVTLSETSNGYGLGDDDETFTLSFTLHPKRILGHSASHQVARVVLHSQETIGDLLLRLSNAQVGLFAPDA